MQVSREAHQQGPARKAVEVASQEEMDQEARELMFADDYDSVLKKFAESTDPSLIHERSYS